MRKLIILIMVLILSIYPVSAVDLNDVVPDLIKLGFDKVVKGVGNDLYSLSGANDTTDKNAPMTSLIISSNEQFINNDYVQKMKDFNAFWFSFCYLMYVFIGAFLVWKNNTNPLPSMSNGFSIYGEYVSGDKYVKTVIWGIIIFLFMYFGLDYIFKVEYLISQGIASETFNIMPPGVENAIGYLMGALIYAMLAGFFYFRYLVVGITTAFLPFLLGLFLFPYLRGIVKTIISYALLMLFSRIILAFAMAAGIALIQSLPLGLGTTQFPYLVLGFLMAVLALVIVLGPYTVIKWAKSGIKTIAVAI